MLVDVGLFILRVTVGLLFAAHGAQKLFGWFGGNGLKKHAAWLESLGLRPAWFWAWVNALAELGGGLMLTFGVLTPIAVAALISVMVVAIVLVHAAKGLWNTHGGYEYNLVLIASGFTLGLGGHGGYALDPWLMSRMAWLGNLPEWQLFVGALVVGLIGAGIGLISSLSKPQLKQRPM